MIILEDSYFQACWSQNLSAPSSPSASPCLAAQDAEDNVCPESCVEASVVCTRESQGCVHPFYLKP